jgi:CelD/BcsL family acetyltransferase involved in cellulose biosynthesis
VLPSLDFSGDLLGQWDRLAIEAERPHAAPAWSLAWWRHVRPDGARAAAIVVREDSRLVGILPLYEHRRRYAALGAGLIPVEPLAVPGREPEVAAALAEALDRIRPRPRSVTIEAGDDSPDWAGLIAAAWPGGRLPWRRTVRVSPAPRLELEGEDFEQWLASKSGNFRHDIRRKAKRIRKEGGEPHLADLGSLGDDVESFLALHLQRHPKGSPLADGGVAAMLREVGTELLPAGRFRLASLNVDGRPEAALVLSSAGGRVSAWSSGMGDGLVRHSPVMQIFVEEIEGMGERGERTMDLGPGEYAYKERLATVVGELTTTVLIPPGPGHFRSRGAYLARDGVGEALRGARRGASSLAGALRRRD